MSGDADVLICGASFGGLAVARELRGSGARVLVLDRYEVGERQTSACGIPTSWLDALDLRRSLRQTFDELVVHTPHADVRYPLPWSFSTFDYRTLCEDLYAQGDAEFETATVTGRAGETVVTDRGELRAPLIVDALGWRRVLGARRKRPAPEAFLSRGLEVHPAAPVTTWRSGSTAATSAPATAGAFRPTGELRSASARLSPRDHVREPTVQLASDLEARRRALPGQLDPAQAATARSRTASASSATRPATACR